MASYLPDFTRESIALANYEPLPEDQSIVEGNVTDRKQKLRRRISNPSLSIFRWWLPELFASLLSIASLASLIAVLHHYQGQGIPSSGDLGPKMLGIPPPKIIPGE